jgi:hypothetical protein
VFSSYNPNPRNPNFVLGMVLGLTVALAWHWVAWKLL